MEALHAQDDGETAGQHRRQQRRAVCAAPQGPAMWRPLFALLGAAAVALPLVATHPAVSHASGGSSSGSGGSGAVAVGRAVAVVVPVPLRPPPQRRARLAVGPRPRRCHRDHLVGLMRPHSAAAPAPNDMATPVVPASPTAMPCTPQVAPSMYALSVSPTVMRIGYATTIDVSMPTLSGPCGATVTLSSSDPTDSSVSNVPQLPLPATLFIPAYTSWASDTIVPSGTANAVITARNVTNSMSAPHTVVAS